MRRAIGLPMILLSACLCSCGEQKLECGADAVVGTLSSMVSERVLCVAADAYPASFDAAKRAAPPRTRPDPLAWHRADAARTRPHCNGARFPRSVGMSSATVGWMWTARVMTV